MTQSELQMAALHENLGTLRSDLTSAQERVLEAERGSDQATQERLGQ